MIKIKNYVEQIDEEIEGAKCYAETYLEMKANGETSWANKYKDMANQELNHATIIHDRAVEEINKLSKVYTPPVEMQDTWDKAHKTYVEKTAWIKQMLTM